MDTGRAGPPGRVASSDDYADRGRGRCGCRVRDTGPAGPGSRRGAGLSGHDRLTDKGARMGARRDRGQGRIYLRGPLWWVGYSHRGHEYRESSGSTKRADASKLLRRRLGELGIGTFVGPSAERVTAADVLALVTD